MDGQCVYLNAFDNGLQARHDIGKWIRFYNETRPHSTFDGQTPDEVYYDFQYQGYTPDIEAATA
ncbi:MAG: integrase core domain-containing protein [Alphaproteobacteria bacterium]|nr:integrase core domain-containing protein [Alphaproteobacteria bacterium]